MASGATTCLSRKDASVLGALFDPEAALQPAVLTREDPPKHQDIARLSEVKSLERQALLQINEERPSLNKVQTTIAQLDNIIERYPWYASAWSNRAQATRMLSELSKSPLPSAELKRIYADLTKAIELSTPTDATLRVSSSDVAVLAAAHTHRGYLLWSSSRPEASIGELDAVEGLQGLDKQRLEELASHEFSLGGRYGNQIAQQLAVKTNPYAKLCGSIVREAIQKEMIDYQEQLAMAV